MSWLRRAWWALTHPVETLVLGLFLLFALIAPEAALVVLFIVWSHEQRWRVVPQLIVDGRRYVKGSGFVMRDL